MKFFYMFPIFSWIGQILHKVQEDRTDAVLVAPIWRTQSWWPSLLGLICSKCYQVPQTRQNHYLPYNREREYPLKRLNLGVFCILGENSKTGRFKREQGILSCHPGETVLNKSTTLTFLSGLNFAAQTELIPFNPL